MTLEEIERRIGRLERVLNAVYDEVEDASRRCKRERIEELYRESIDIVEEIARLKRERLLVL